MGKMEEFLTELNIQKETTTDDLPEIDLYMDQVIQLFEKKFAGAKRQDEEKVLTKTMINNYAKAKLFPPVKNKRYTKEHLMLISLIYQMKGVLSITDIKETLHGINDRLDDDDFNFTSFYKSYQNLVFHNTEIFTKQIQDHSAAVKDELKTSMDADADELENILLITSLASLSNLYRRAAESLIDELNGQQQEKEK
ncbi:DUF1836 domain-containing protein [Evansella clarkii]|jgi:hypothetical protein|uniref:DUF1836 domain-containing protein n=1 Tax=Evansella clarkii TaxID=79879 RepID=UPI0009976F73|nr:DUF1836 domain-containing protein [Evansella clarkii]